MSMLSLEPATTIDGSCASMATAGSFCLFCENGDRGLPTVTSVPVAGLAGASVAGAGLAIAAPVPISTTNSTAAAAANFGVRIGPPCREQARRNAVPSPLGPLPPVPQLGPVGRPWQDRQATPSPQATHPRRAACPAAATAAGNAVQDRQHRVPADDHAG